VEGAAFNRERGLAAPNRGKSAEKATKAQGRSDHVHVVRVDRRGGKPYYRPNMGAVIELSCPSKA
jgi:hypothetical protein